MVFQSVKRTNEGTKESILMPLCMKFSQSSIQILGTTIMQKYVSLSHAGRAKLYRGTCTCTDNLNAYITTFRQTFVLATSRQIRAHNISSHIINKYDKCESVSKLRQANASRTARVHSRQVGSVCECYASAAHTLPIQIVTSINTQTPLSS